MSEKQWIGAIVGVGLLARLGVMLAPFRWQLQHILPDDAFYYFTTARNIAEGNGITFDRIADTNGFHPLWMGAIVPFWGLFSCDTLPIRGVLLLCGVLDLATVVIFYRLGVLLGWRRSLRLGVAAAHAVSPFLIAHFGTMNGLETSAAVMLLSLSLYFYLRLLLGNNPRDWKWLGATVGLALAARVDALVVIAPLLLHLFVSLRPCWRRVRWVVVFPAMLLAPWLLWSLMAVGTMQQSSGRALQFMATEFLWSDSPSLWEWFARVSDNLAAVLRTIPIPFLGKPLVLLFWAGVVAMVGWRMWGVGHSAGSSVGRVKSPSNVTPFPAATHGGRGLRFGSSGWVIAALIAGVLLFVVAHTIYGGVMRSWYSTLLYPSVLVALGIGINSAPKRQSLGRGVRWGPVIPAAAVAGLLAVGFWNGWNREGGEVLKYKGAMKAQEAIAAMPDSLRPKAVGAWNAGIVGYFLPMVGVVNLDGVLSHDAIDAAANHGLAKYATAKNITMLIDDPATLRVWAKHWRDGCKNISDEFINIDTIAEAGRLLLIGRLPFTRIP